MEPLADAVIFTQHGRPEEVLRYVPGSASVLGCACVCKVSLQSDQSLKRAYMIMCSKVSFSTLTTPCHHLSKQTVRPLQLEAGIEA